MEQTMDDFPKNLSQPARRALASQNIHNLRQLSKFSKEYLAGLHGIGPKAIRQLEEALNMQGLQFLSKS